MGCAAPWRTSHDRCRYLPQSSPSVERRSEEVDDGFDTVRRLRPLLRGGGPGRPDPADHPAGATASTWGAATQELARIGRVLIYDRRGYARSGGDPVRSVATHTADAAALLEALGAPPAVVVGTSAGAAIAVDLAVRRPELVRVVIAHEFPWRFTRHRPSGVQAVALARIGSLVLRDRQGDAAEALLRAAYSYRDGSSAWDAFPEAWRQAARDNARATLVGLPQLDRHLSIPEGSGDRRGPRGVQLRRPQPHQHGPPRPIVGRGHPHGQNPANRGSRPPAFRCNNQLRAADHQRHRTCSARRPVRYPSTRTHWPGTLIQPALVAPLSPS